MIQDLRKKCLGAWLGKAVGGTLGAPWEGSSGPLDLTFYRPVPTEMLPNDDLDLQILWACHLATDWNKTVSMANFAKSWSKNVAFPFDEYGVVIRNLKMGIPAPWSGQYDNFFVDGLGAAIRSELWAILAAGEPEKAAKLAYLDAAMDHDGNGVYAEQFLAALESAAFVESDIQKLIRTGLSVIPVESRLAQAITSTCKWCEETQDPVEIRKRIRAEFGSANFTDVKMNLAFETAALLLGKGDFAKSICTAVNFGQDTDCTGATVGSILGIIAPESIPEKWLAPIGRKLVLSKEITGITPPDNLDDFTDLVLQLRDGLVIDESHPEKPDFSKFTISCKKSYFAPWFAADYRKFAPVPAQNAKTVNLPGNLVTLDFTDAPGDALTMLEIPFTLKEDRKVRLLVNTPATVHVWVDGNYRFGRDGGVMVPAFHRAPSNQALDLELKAGTHKLVLGVAPANEDMKKAPLLFGIASMDKQWITGLFQ